MKISLLTLFPNMFTGPFDESIIKRAKEKGLVEINLVDIRQFGIGKHQLVDDTPYGGGIGMVLRVDVIHQAIMHTKIPGLTPQEEKVFLMSAGGVVFTQKIALEFSSLKHIILICGHYEGVDGRIEEFIDGELSVGEYVLTGGEIPAMIVTDAVARLIPGVLKEDATTFESFSTAESDLAVEHRQYTRPQEYNGQSVPTVLLSGNHKEILAWRKNDSHVKTKQNRPDLLK